MIVVISFRWNFTDSFKKLWTFRKSHLISQFIWQYAPFNLHTSIYTFKSVMLVLLDDTSRSRLTFILNDFVEVNHFLSLDRFLF